MTIEDLANDEFLVALSAASGQTLEEVALHLWELDRAGLLDHLVRDVEVPRNRAERRAAHRRRQI